MSFELRDYQSVLVEKAEVVLRRDERPLVEAATGAGKTVILAELARRALARGERVVAIAHREEIIAQIVGSLRRHLGPRVRIEAVIAGARSRYVSPVTVAMVPTISRRLDRISPLRRCTLLADEAHHCGANTWRATIDALAPHRMVGFTATPLLPNGKGLGRIGIFDELIRGPKPEFLFSIGALCSFRMFAAPKRIDTKGMKKRAGDFLVAEMEKKVVEINGEIVRDWLRFNPGRARTIFVGVSVPHSNQVAAMFRQHGITAAAVDGKTQKAERARIFAAFRSGELEVLCACAVIDEGLDVPEATVLQLARPIASLRLYRQLLGRVLRPSPGKAEALIVDHTDTWERLPPPNRAIDWRLDDELQLPEEQRQPVLLEGGEIFDREPPAPPPELEVVGNGLELREITPELVRSSRPQDVRAMLNAQATAEAREALAGIRAPASLRPWIARMGLLSDETVELLGEALGMPRNWTDGQLFLNGLQTVGQRLALTKHVQATWR
jgi:superfamily II DNA or RNA helicase